VDVAAPGAEPGRDPRVLQDLDAGRDTYAAGMNQVVVNFPQFADHYSRALEHLGSGNLDVRIGGIYALELLARDSPRYHPTVMDVLSAFIREHSRTPPEGIKSGRWPLPDVQAALAVIGRRMTEHDIRRMDLTRADLTRADLSGADLTDVSFVGANLTGANFYTANLTGAALTGANLRNADFGHANLTRTSLSGANCGGANLRYVNLTGAIIRDADLTGVRLADTNFTGTDLTATRWSEDIPVPESWRLDENGRLASGTGHQGLDT
jgi:hypothetical protein